MTFGPLTTISPTVPRGTSLSSASTMRTSVQHAALPAEYILPLTWCSGVWNSAPRVVAMGDSSVMP
ncbi:hypothetical protein D3C78_1245660 [compost metagenome]